ncbi:MULTISPECIES: ATP-NAD kinase family protein [Microbacterium]|uniref:NAD(+)/NADH kinase n=1 Tax=Microbacterium maritypicum TaxID=33918 RepID=A0ACD4B793_MICMQ|nr:MULTISPECIES: NAD(+)/NADH kinase [Microbacterium]EYT57728.1 NAD+ kinase [Microbacterium sp. UCD-TDU]UTT53263.1 NAD(+)/NADH kinase [Microbacterium liquefaciens]
MIGLVVNPVAGVGGPAGLAGSDGADVQRLALARGARSRVQERAVLALTTLAERHPGLVVATAAGAMGADAVRAAGLVPRVVAPALGVERSETEAGDTSRAVAALAADGVDLILVVGGDGTLRDAVAGLDVAENPSGAGTDVGRHADTRMPAVLGVPAGVKMYSPVFAVSPRAAGAIAADWIDLGGLPTDEREVLDIDEAAMRRARVDPTLYGMLRVPYRSGRTQARKAPTPVTEAAAVEAAARGAVARMLPGIRYLLGPGGTTAEIARQLGVEGSPLGVDVVLDGTVVVCGASEQELLAAIDQGPAQAVVTVIGGQGFLLGRGNQQLSAAVLRALGDDPLLVVAPEQKLIDLHGRPLLVDTGDPELDARLAGHVRIVTGAGTSSLYAVSAPELTP